MYSSRGSGGYGQSYTGQSAYAQNVSGFISSVFIKFNVFLIDLQFLFLQDLYSLKNKRLSFPCIFNFQPQD